MATAQAPKAEYQKGRSPKDESGLEMLKRLTLSREAHHTLDMHCRKVGIEFLSTAFDEKSLDFLTGEIGVKRIKIASGEITNGPLLLHAARMGLPIILSTGMSCLSEIEDALGVLAFGMEQHGSPQGRDDFKASFDRAMKSNVLQGCTTLLHCTTQYPAPINATNLRAMKTMAVFFGLEVGYSDHTPGIHIASAAVALGARVIEKHLTLDQGMEGPDHQASLEPDELGRMIDNIREVESSLGTGEKIAAGAEKKNIPLARKSLVAARPISKGTVFDACDIVAKRPAVGMSPMLYWEVVGEVATRDFVEDEAISL